MKEPELPNVNETNGGSYGNRNNSGELQDYQQFSETNGSTARLLHLVLINKNKRTCQFVDFLSLKAIE